MAAAIDGEPPDLTLRLAALFHAAPVAEIEALLAALRFPRRVAIDVAALAARHACLREGEPEDPVSPPVVRRWLAGVGPERAQALLALREAEVAALPAPRRARAAPGRETSPGALRGRAGVGGAAHRPARWRSTAGP